jgi:hypothetical protein
MDEPTSDSVEEGSRVPGEYLGDGLYADFDGWQIELFASNGISKTNRVFLEPVVLRNFLAYAERLKGK